MGPVDGSQPCRQVEIAPRGLWMARKSVFEPPNDDGRGDTTETNMSKAAESRFVTSRDTFLHGAAEHRRCRRPTEWAIRWQGCRDVTRPANGSIEGVAKALCGRGGPAALRVIPLLN